MLRIEGVKGALALSLAPSHAKGRFRSVVEGFKAQNVTDETLSNSRQVKHAMICTSTAFINKSTPYGTSVQYSRIQLQGRKWAICGPLACP
jgi:hypothetical protein